LWELIEKGEVPEKYFLSPNAAKGMLRRADRMERELFPPLRKALEIMSKARS
jgi:DNA (cytosine-5)-methyltransferase 1